MSNTIEAGNTQPATSNAVAGSLDSFLTVISSDVRTESIGAGVGSGFSFHFVVPSGYKALCMAGFGTSGPAGKVTLYSAYALNVFGKTGEFYQAFYFRNYSNETQSVEMSVQLLCMKVI